MHRARLIVASSSFLLAACGGTVVFDEDGGSDGGQTGDGGRSSVGTGDGGAPTTSDGTSASVTNGPVSTVVGTTGPSVTAVAPGVTTGPIAGICGVGVTFLDGAADACLGNACCAAFDECTRFGEDVAGCQACLDGQGGECRFALECATQSGCYPDGIGCAAGLEFVDPEIQQCLGDRCCVEQLFCTSAGASLQQCIDCFAEDGGPRCDPLLACAAAECGDGADQICDSGLAAEEPQANQCLSDNCCEPFRQCTDFGNDARGCLDCFNLGGGEQCDAAVACSETFGCFDLDRDDDGDGDAG